MIELPTRGPRTTGGKDRIIIALDISSDGEARSVVTELQGEVGAFKVGLQLFTAAGPQAVTGLTDLGAKIFLDLKFHDIPNTVAKAAIQAARLGVWMFNVHCLGGSEMMRRTVEEVSAVCEKENLNRPLIFGVTVLTSSDVYTLNETGIDLGVEQEVTKLARIASAAGLDGVVASPREIVAIRNEVENPHFLIVTPGVRPDFATNDDQKRIMTPSEAISSGSDYLVIGRPVTAAENRLSAVQRIIEEIEA